MVLGMVIVITFIKTNPLKYSLFILFLAIIISNTAQDKSPFHFSATVGLGPSIGTIENTGINKFHMGIGFGIETVAQFGYR
ncbi:MAG: hypothetical protein JKY54_17210 [Flavobacteriales bacterium]|nr:hypothetical protein [Flavobacteriales bacterium]